MQTNSNINHRTRWAVVAIFASLAAVGCLSTVSAQTSADLGTADSFAILAGSTVTNTGFTVINGDLGLHPGTSVTGFPPGVVNGETHINDAVAEQAKVDLGLAYDEAEAQPSDATLPPQLGGETLTQGVYDSETGAFLITGALTLDAQGNESAAWIFQMGSTLTTASESSVVLINGADACNVFWQVGSSATLGTDSEFQGTIMALASITLNTGASLEGRALARTAAVTLDDNLVTAPECTAVDPPVDDPPGDDPPGDDPPGDDPPGDDPPGDDPPGDDPPGDDPPGDDPPGDDPPGDDPPGDDPPGDDPPGDDPPGDDPPGDGPPGDDPPGDEPIVCLTNVMASANEDSSITLTWTAVEAQEYRIYRADDAGDLALHDTVEGNVTTFIDTATEVGVTYSYEVRPVDAGIELEDCGAVEVTAIPFFPGLLAVPLAMVGGVAAYALGRRRT